MAVAVDNFNPDSLTDTATWNVEFMLLCVISSTCLSSFGLWYLITMFASLQCMACCIPLLQVTGHFWMCREISICSKTKRFIEHFCCQLFTSFQAITLSDVLTLLIGQRSPLLFAILAFFCSLTFNVCILLSVVWCCWLHDRKDPVCKNCTSEQPKIG